MTDAARRGIHAGACTGVIAFCAAMIFGATGEPMRLPWYEPLEHRWILSTSAPTTVAMDYYARIGLSFLVAFAGAAAGYAIAFRRELSPALTRALGFWAWAITALALFLYAHALLTRHVEPPPTPPTRGL